MNLKIGRDSLNKKGRLNEKKRREQRRVGPLGQGGKQHHLLHKLPDEKNECVKEFTNKTAEVATFEKLFDEKVGR